MLKLASLINRLPEQQLRRVNHILLETCISMYEQEAGYVDTETEGDWRSVPFTWLSILPKVGIVYKIVSLMMQVTEKEIHAIAGHLTEHIRLDDLPLCQEEIHEYIPIECPGHIIPQVVCVPEEIILVNDKPVYEEPGLSYLVGVHETIIGKYLAGGADAVLKYKKTAEFLGCAEAYLEAKEKYPLKFRLFKPVKKPILDETTNDKEVIDRSLADDFEYFTNDKRDSEL